MVVAAQTKRPPSCPERPSNFTTITNYAAVLTGSVTASPLTPVSMRIP